MGDAMKITRTSWRLAGMRPPTPGGSSSAEGNQGAQGSKGTEKGEVAKGVYVPCWNIGKHSRLMSKNEKKKRVDNILPPGARTKFEI